MRDEEVRAMREHFAECEVALEEGLFLDEVTWDILENTDRGVRLNDDNSVTELENYRVQSLSPFYSIRCEPCGTIVFELT